ncbi:peptide/nickel transport system substrate-binding protein [Devosia lucknowensis]|uniref:Peptide/nickel transport system substrate-binding protein n=1 Tax=Devosia lucknowensis TaxID=1096929 RepID=A0A1Y6G6U6_9HYPH|nr:ABC transporter substrate-binding protein [Devosia lucknowensis]SMQ85484.1 peptide/nickel transport system substrate-binding protein [Devosia lucknowensis]
MHRISRRAFIAGSAALSGAIMFSGTARGQGVAESAFLESEVSSGALPPVAERLPVNPLVITPLERAGQQGGDWNHALVGGGSLSMLVRYQGYEPLVRFNPEWTGLVENVAESYEVSEDSTEYTIKLRAGHKWSDGHPFTTEDIQFWYDAYFTDEETNLGEQAFWIVDGQKADLEVIDETTFKVRFAGPNGFFLQQLAWAQQDQLTRCPKHYLEQFHIRYNPEADALAQSAGLESWIALFQREVGFQDDNTFFQNANRPTLNAWYFTEAPGQNTELSVATRNPYYFKVDTEGTQLPYFDRIVYQMVADPEVLLLKTLQGEIDIIDQYIATPANRPTLFDGQETGNYQFYTLRETAANVMAFQLNLNHLDETKRNLFNTIEFRHAMSLAVDRQALIDAVFIGQGTPAQPSIVETDALYNEQLAKQFTEYDPARANEMLDAIIPDRDGENYRLDAEGRRVSIIFEIDQTRTTFLDMFELAIPMFQQVGLDVQMRTMDRSLWEERVRRGREYDATAHQFGANSGIAAMLDARFYVPTNSNCFYAPGWSLYFTQPDNEAAVEPPEAVKAQQDLYRELNGTGDPAAQNEIMAQILQNAADLFFTFGVSWPADGYGIVKNDVVNLMDIMPNSFGWPTPGPARPEQFFKA